MKKKESAFLKRLGRIGTGEERGYLIENLAMLLSSGMDVLRAVASIKQELRSKTMKHALDDIEESINSGYGIGEALEKTGLFPEYVTALLKVGEEGGRLDESLQVIAVQQAKSRDFQSKIRSAMMYPSFVLCLAFVAGIGIAWFILPRLASVFSQLNLKLPFITRVLIGFGAFLSSYGSIFIPGLLLVIAIVIYFLFFFKRTKFIGQAILFYIPGIKNLIREVELARFGYLMGTLLEGGLPIVYALHSLQTVTSLIAYRRLYEHLESGIQDGGSFDEAFGDFRKSRRLVPMPVQGLVVAGEQSGHLTESFLNIAKNYEARSDITTKNLSVILEPVLLVLVWLGVLAVALAVILPIYSLVGGLTESGGGAL